MKRFLVLIALLAVAALGMAGCCKLTNANGVTTTSFANCITSAENYACNPPASVMTSLNASAVFVATIINATIPGSAAFINATNAAGAIATLQQSGCIGLTSLNTLVAYLSALTGPAKAGVALNERVVESASTVNLGPLIEWSQAQGCTTCGKQ